MTPAPIGDRVAAQLIDFLLGMGFVLAYQATLTVFAIRVNFLELMIQCALIFLTVCTINLLGVAGDRGSTVGKRLMGLWVLSEHGESIGRARAILRATLGYAVSGSCLGLGFLWALWDFEGRCWHDKLFGTRVVKWHKS
jgi:uncharacterized RDD family membrane protein YckC